ncbi:SDR family NAD(P)-dependent oxidoreductase [Limosilactobacillus sp.]|uniref:SDR family NAD(P)-dependent oxidoreductase n=1 Tax=Limosilactobacillus sp. TaxID=2773925 RepID=UPI00359F840D
MANMNGKVAIITGASSGFGKGTALAFAKEGCNLVLNARHENNLKKVADECTQFGVKVVYQTGDAADEQVARQTVQLALNTFGRIDELMF